MKIDFRNILILALAACCVILFFRSCGNEAPTVEVKETRTQTIDIKKTIDEAINNALAKQQPEKVPYIIYRDKVVKVTDGTNLNSSDLSNVQELNVYKDTTRLKNATVYSEIVSDGTVYSNGITAEVNETVITNTITKETTVMGSGLFVTGGVGVGTGLNLDNIELGLDYIYKNDVGLGFYGEYNIQTKTPSAGVRLSKKIF